jgi:hypothetical protein
MRELNVDVGFETKKMKVERTQMLSSEGYIYHWIKLIGKSVNKCYTFLNFFQGSPSPSAKKDSI